MASTSPTARTCPIRRVIRSEQSAAANGTMSGVEIAELVLAYIKALIWPTVVLAVVLRFRGQIGELISRARAVDTVIGSVEFAEQARDLLAEAQQESGAPTPASSPRGVVRRLQAARTTLSGGTILWVDDHPGNNASLIKLLRASGIEVHTALSTEEALGKLSSQTYDILLTDLARNGDTDAGNALLRQLTSRGYDIPAVVYSRPALIERGVDRRAFAATYRPDELIHYVIDLMGRAAAAR
jgi:CheY-like chemotaxis protein